MKQITAKDLKRAGTIKLHGGAVIIATVRKGETTEDVLSRIMGKRVTTSPLHLGGRKSPEEKRLIKEDGIWRWDEAYGLMSAREIAAHSGIALRRVNRAIKDGLIKTRTIGPPENPLTFAYVASAKRWAKKLAAATAP